MAKLVEEIVTVKISRIVKDEAAAGESIVTPEVLSGIEAMTEQMVGEHSIVEVTTQA